MNDVGTAPQDGIEPGPLDGCHDTAKLEQDLASQTVGQPSDELEGGLTANQP